MQHPQGQMARLRCVCPQTLHIGRFGGIPEFGPVIPRLPIAANSETAGRVQSRVCRLGGPDDLGFRANRPAAVLARLHGSAGGPPRRRRERSRNDLGETISLDAQGIEQRFER